MTTISNTGSNRKVGRSIALEAGKALNKDRTVFLIPVFSFFLHIVVGLIAVVAWILCIPFMHTNANGTTIVNTTIGIVFYLLLAFVNVGTQATVMAMANQVYEGKNPSIRESFGLVLKHSGSLSGLAILEGTVGIILRALQRAGGENPILRVIFSLISFIVGMAWAVATYFAIPFIIFKDQGSLTSIKSSALLVKEKWGAALRVNVVVGALMVLGFLASLGGVIGGVALALTGVSNGDTNQFKISGGLAIVGISLILFIAMLLINSTLMAYVRVALFRYATGQKIEGFDTSNLDNAFVLSKAKNILS
jgi:uncharacterized membrane protein (DUF485 family)